MRKASALMMLAAIMAGLSACGQAARPAVEAGGGVPSGVEAAQPVADDHGWMKVRSGQVQLDFELMAELPKPAYFGPITAARNGTGLVAAAASDRLFLFDAKGGVRQFVAPPGPEGNKCLHVTTDFLGEATSGAEDSGEVAVVRCFMPRAAMDVTVCVWLPLRGDAQYTFEVKRAAYDCGCVEEGGRFAGIVYTAEGALCYQDLQGKVTKLGRPRAIKGNLPGITVVAGEGLIEAVRVIGGVPKVTPMTSLTARQVFFPTRAFIEGTSSVCTRGALGLQALEAPGRYSYWEFVREGSEWGVKRAEKNVPSVNYTVFLPMNGQPVELINTANIPPADDVRWPRPAKGSGRYQEGLSARAGNETQQQMSSWIMVQPNRLRLFAATDDTAIVADTHKMWRVRASRAEASSAPAASPLVPMPGAARSLTER